MQFLAAAARFVPFITIGAWYFVKSLPQVFKLLFELGKLHESRKYTNIQNQMKELTEQVNQLRRNHERDNSSASGVDQRNP